MKLANLRGRECTEAISGGQWEEADNALRQETGWADASIGPRYRGWPHPLIIASQAPSTRQQRCRRRAARRLPGGNWNAEQGTGTLCVDRRVGMGWGSAGPNGARSACGRRTVAAGRNHRHGPEAKRVAPAHARCGQRLHIRDAGAAADQRRSAVAVQCSVAGVRPAYRLLATFDARHPTARPAR